MSYFNQDYFALFGLPRQFRQQVTQLERSWHSLAQLTHPDRYTQTTEAEQRVALMSATQVNQAYHTLRSPLARARYLLHLAGADSQENSDAKVPLEFLTAQIEWHERIEAARISLNIEELQRLSTQLADDIHHLETKLAVLLDDQQDWEGAALLVRKWRFLEKLDQEIADALDPLLSVPPPSSPS